MAGLFAEPVLDEILARTDIVDLISAFIPLKKAGRNFKACCPFHKEKTASFVVSADKQIYHCFGCGAGGNAFNFLIQYERMEFPEAVEFLAKKAGIVLPEKNRPSTHQNAGLISRVSRINELTAEYYEGVLRSAAGKPAHQYLDKRGIRPETARAFRLGFAPDMPDSLANFLKSRKIDASAAQTAGVLVAGNNGAHKDRFRNRVIFPIADVKGSVIGFGGRILSSQSDAFGPKYLNSPETPVYVKGRHLYGLNIAKDAIRRDDIAIVVEGYLDCVIPHQSGLNNVVASLGTALTPEQIRLLKRYTHNVCLLFDGDTAGQSASVRSLDDFIDEGIHLTIAVLPEGHDPDTYAREFGADRLKELIKNARSIFDYKIDFLARSHDARTIEGKAQLSAEMLPTIARFKNAILKSEYIKKLSDLLNLSEQALIAEMGKIKQSYGAENDGGERPVYRKTAVNPTEQLIIKLMLDEIGIIQRIRDRLDPSDFQDGRTSRIVSLILELTADGKKPSPNTLMNRMGGEDIMKLICESTFLPDIPPGQKEKVIEDCIKRLKSIKATVRKQQIQTDIKSAQIKGDHAMVDKLMLEFQDLIKKG